MVQKFLDSQTAPATMQIEEILTGGPNAAVAHVISFSTARGWLARLGWIWGRGRKGYVGGREGEGVEYRERASVASVISTRS